jgi:organic radical activating enzyme
MPSKVPNYAEGSFLKNVGFMLTYKCNICCPHCIVEAGPHRKEVIDLTEACDWIKQAREYRGGYILALALTGGEPFYDMGLLKKIAEYASSLGFIVSAVTNAYWATTPQIAEKTLEEVPAIQVLSFSTDPYHIKSVPFKNIENAIRASKKLGRLYAISVCTDNEQNPQYKQIITSLNAMGEEANTKTALTIPVGRAQKYATHLRFEYTQTPSEGACTAANYPVIFPDGTVLACNGPAIGIQQPHPLYLGNLRQEKLQTILGRAETNSYVHIIRMWGPRKLAQLLTERGQEHLLPDQFIKGSQCDTCYKLFTDKEIINALNTILQDKKIIDLIAYGRLYYFNEATMLQQLNIA